MKEWYRSKVIWIAILQGVGGVVAAFITSDPDAQAVAGLLVLKSFLDIALRALTTTPIVSPVSDEPLA